MGKKLVDVQVLVTEAIAIGEALSIVGDRSMDKILIETDSQFMINFIKGLSKVRNQISNPVIDIVNLARNFNNIWFSYCTIINFLVDGIGKMSQLYLE